MWLHAEQAGGVGPTFHVLLVAPSNDQQLFPSLKVIHTTSSTACLPDRQLHSSSVALETYALQEEGQPLGELACVVPAPGPS